jgi:hypothetical protein
MLLAAEQVPQVKTALQRQIEATDRHAKVQRAGVRTLQVDSGGDQDCCHILR